ncbi:hypothetical protein IQ265_09055 [Nodosilinea sp. LEGE 06152]|uniref:hypothetical protein n=1 Tax=Nodosilinea sp. LEGE 06152 TaxID=2777966 RepID=UPI00187EA0FF|nr:hypothetical protein [Nodosilinea sp. LEGE 06152]MBE9156974.1 hypothetical protein [Nodosilinea sp. LEGE 06152]
MAPENALAIAVIELALLNTSNPITQTRISRERIEKTLRRIREAALNLTKIPSISQF